MKKISSQSYPKSILQGLQLGERAFANAISSKIKYAKININCNSLPKPIWIKGDKSDTKSILVDLPENDCPCLYYLEILEGNTREIMDSFKEFKYGKPATDRATPAIKKNIDYTTKTLYVGKVKRDVWSRMRTHLGYYHVGATAGLQLVSWATDIDLILRAHIYGFDPEMKESIGGLELNFAKSLNPLIGRH
ncbi:MAG: hypothetical protein ABJG78_02975 [Cyclobacteriaceae bacterium]